MSYKIYNYVYELENYTKNPFLLKEYKTISIDNTNDNEGCHIITTLPENQEYLYEETSSSSLDTLSTDLSSEMITPDIKTIIVNTKNIKNKNKENDVIRSCDHFSGKIIETNKEVKLEINDPKKELLFKIEYGDISISSYDMIKFINKFGSKKLQRTFNIKYLYDNFRDSEIIKIYDEKNIFKILNEVNKIFLERMPKPHSIKQYKFEDIIKEMKEIDEIKNEEMNVEKMNYVEKFVLSIRKCYEKSYVLFMESKKNDNIITFGDFHGSLSTFVRHLLRLKKVGIIDKNGKIAGKYKLIFLGDIVDRGIYSYEILMILYLLIINNPDKIILNNGNHESLNVNGLLIDLYSVNEGDCMHKNNVGNFINEIISKFVDTKIALKIFVGINNIFLIQPTAILYKTGDEKYIYMAHGCLPHDMNNVNKLDENFVKGLKTGKSFYIENNVKMSIQWNDFYGGDETISSNRNIGKLIQKVGKNILNCAIKNGIEFIVRGHEDLYYNTKIMKNNGTMWMSIKDETKKTNKKLLCKVGDKKIDNMTHILSVKNDKLMINGDETDYLPIITISTNTDIGKNLTNDSYIIISFGEDIEMNCVGGGKKYLKYNVKNKKL